MAFIGIPVYAPPFYMYDLQVNLMKEENTIKYVMKWNVFLKARFALTFITGAKKVSQGTMRKDTQNFEKAYDKGPFPRSQIHQLKLSEHQNYYKDLSKTAGGIKNVPELISDVFTDAIKQARENPNGFRNNQYTLTKTKFQRH